MRVPTLIRSKPYAAWGTDISFDRFRLRGRIVVASLLLAAAPAIVAWGLGVYDRFELRRMADQLERSSQVILRNVEANPTMPDSELDQLAREHVVNVWLLNNEGDVEHSTDLIFFPLLEKRGWGPFADFFFGPQGPPDIQRFEREVGPLLDRKEVKLALQGREATEERRPAVPNMVVSYRALPLRDGGVLYAARATRRSARMLFDFRFQLLKLTLWLLLGATLMSLWLGWRVVGPLSRLQRSIQDYVEGGKRTSLALDRRDEIGALSRDFDSLTFQLESRAAETARSAADLAHQLKNPIAAIRSSVEHLSDATPIDGQRKERIVGALDRSVQRLEQTVTALMDLARLEGSLPNEERTRFDLVELGCHVAEQAKLTNPRLEIRVEGEQVSMMGIKPRIEELIDNLVTNAAAFAESQVVLKVQTKDNEIYLAVQDDGPGVSPSDQAKVFQRFFSGRRPEEGGSGLGLPIVQTIARAHGGEAKLVSEFEGGACFEVSFRRLP